MTTHTIAFLPYAPQCITCSSAVRYEPVKSFATVMADKFILATCHRCDVTMKVPVTILECEVV